MAMPARIGRKLFNETREALIKNTDEVIEAAGKSAKRNIIKTPSSMPKVATVAKEAGDSLKYRTSSLLSDAEKVLSKEQLEDLAKLRKENAKRINVINSEGSNGKVYDLNRTGQQLTSRAKNTTDANGNIVGRVIEKPGYSGDKVNKNSINGFQETMDWQGRDVISAKDSVFAKMTDEQWQNIEAGKKKTEIYNKSPGSSNKAAKVTDPKGNGNNMAFKIAAGGIGGYTVFNMFNNRGQQSNSQLYGQY